MGYGPIIPTLHVASIGASIEFYQDTLDFDLKWSWSNSDGFDEGSPADFACLERDQAVLFLSADGGGREGTLFIELPFVQDVDKLAAEIADRAVVFDPPADMPWGSREFTVRDPDEHVVRFSCPLDRRR